MSIFQNIYFFHAKPVMLESIGITKHLYHSSGRNVSESITNVNSLDELITAAGGVRMLSEIEVYRNNSGISALLWISQNDSLVAELLTKNEFWQAVKEEFGSHNYLCESKVFKGIWQCAIGYGAVCITELASEFLTNSTYYGSIYGIGKIYLFFIKDFYSNYNENLSNVRLSFLDYMIQKTKK